MTLFLERGTHPNGLPVKNGALVPAGFIVVGEYLISDADMATLAFYWLTNGDLMNLLDQRRQFVKSVKAMEEVDGYNPGGKRFQTNVEPCLREETIQMPVVEPQVAKATEVVQPGALPAHDGD